MRKILSILFTAEAKRILSEISSTLKLQLDIACEARDFYKKLECEEYHSLIIENLKEKINLLKLVKTTKNIHPEIPQIIISEDGDRELISSLHQEGVFYLYVPPIDRDRLAEILKSSLDFFYRKNAFI